MRESWTDARMDDLNTKVDELGRRMDNGFNRVGADIRALRTEMKGESTSLRTEMKGESTSLRGEMNGLRGEMNARFDRIDERFKRMDERFDERFERMHRLLVQLSGAIVVALIGLIATQL